jgi:uncharacterized protein (TIGR02722 family)
MRMHVLAKTVGPATALCGLVLFLSGCAGTVQRVDPTQDRVLNTQFSADDLQQTVDVMVQSMLEFPPMVQITRQRRPVIVVEKMKNNTSQFINLESLTDSIRTKLIRSGKYRFQDRTNDDALANEIRIQQGSGLVDPNTAAQFRKQVGAEFMLYGSISEMTQSGRHMTDVYYKVTLNLRNLQTGVIEWTDEQQIRKLMKKPTFGY